MKICLVSDMEYGSGASITAYRLAAGLAAAGDDVEYVCHYGREGVAYEGFRRAPLEAEAFEGFIEEAAHRLLPLCRETDYVRARRRLERIRTRHGRMNPVGRRLLELEFETHFETCSRRLVRIFERFGPDVVNLHNVGTILRHSDVLKLSRRFPIVWTMHDAFPLRLVNMEYQPVGAPKVTYGKLLNHDRQKNALRSIRRGVPGVSFVTPSDWLQHECEVDADPGLHVRTIANGIDPTAFFPEDKHDARKALGLRSDGFYLLFVANNIDSRLKNFGVVTDALKLLGDQNAGIIAVGESSKATRELDPAASFFPYSPNVAVMRRYYAAADLCISSSYIENLPTVLLESLLCGRPVVGSNVGGTPEIVGRSNPEWTFDPSSPESLRGVLARIRNQELEPASSDALRKIGLEHYSIATQVTAYRAYFEEAKARFDEHARCAVTAANAQAS